MLPRVFAVRAIRSAIAVSLNRPPLRASLDDRDDEPAFGEWPSVSGDAKMTTVLLDRFTHQSDIVEGLLLDAS